MITEIYAIKHTNDQLVVLKYDQQIYNSQWFTDFGKFGCELFNSEGKMIFSMVKKFQFWKWKMVYTIKENNGNLIHLISQNNRKTIYAIDFNEITYEVQSHFKKKTSIFKNGAKIAEVDESFLDKDFTNHIKLQLLDKKDLEVCFLLFSCLKIGEMEQKQKSVITSQKQLEVNLDPWD
jgi:hypothetical protein